MGIKVEGELISYSQSGFGPFKKVRADAEPFSCLLVQEKEPVQATEGLNLQFIGIPGGWVLQGTLKGVLCTFCEFVEDGPRSVSFSMLSVTGYELQGVATLVEPKATSRPRVAG